MRPEVSAETECFERDFFRTAPDALIPYQRDAYVIGTGPSLSPAVLATIRADAWVAVVNKALIDVVERGLSLSRISAWFCATPEYLRHPEKYPWWQRAVELAELHGIPRVFSWQLAAQGVACEYTFYTCPSFGDRNAPDDLTPGVCRSGGTIAMVTLQVPAHCQARRGILCAIDMRGALYADGTQSERREGDEEFSEIEIAVRTVTACQRAGLKVCTLTPTALSNYVEVERL